MRAKAGALNTGTAIDLFGADSATAAFPIRPGNRRLAPFSNTQRRP